MENTQGDGYLLSTAGAIEQLRHARALHDRVQKWLLIVAPCAVVLVAATSLQVNPHPGVAGRHLAVSLTWLACTGGLVVALLSRTRRRQRTAAAAVALAGAVSLEFVQPLGVGLLAVVFSSAILLGQVSRRLAFALAPIGAGLVVLSSLTRGRPTMTASILAIIAVGCVSALLLLAHRLRIANDRAESLLLAARLTQQAELRAATLAERQQLAREMHDVLAHSLSGLILQLEGARLLSRAGTADSRLPPAIERAHHLAKTGLDEARRAIGMLRGDSLPGPERLEELTFEFESTTGIPCSLIVTGESRSLAPDAGLALYRVAQEALTNAAKHASPDVVRIELGYGPEHTTLRIEDRVERCDEHRSRTDVLDELDSLDPLDPFDSLDSIESHDSVGRAACGAPGPAAGSRAGHSESSPTGYGLNGMRERAELLGGSLAARATEHGFAVELTVPG